MGHVQSSENLRESLRDATARAHDLLDGSMRAAAGWENRGDYAQFLKLQYAARLPVEIWLAHRAPPDLQPPAQSPLIAQDLRRLGEALPHGRRCFTLARGEADETPLARAQALGAAWVLAGSSLGNLSILAEVKRISARAAAPWPTRFLGNRDMLDFWKKLRRELEESADPQKVALATQAAASVFEHFIDHAQINMPLRAPSQRPPRAGASL